MTTKMMRCLLVIALIYSCIAIIYKSIALIYCNIAFIYISIALIYCNIAFIFWYFQKFF